MRGFAAQRTALPRLLQRVRSTRQAIGGSIAGKLQARSITSSRSGGARIRYRRPATGAIVAGVSREVQEALEVALVSEGASIESRVAAVQSLGQLAVQPAMAAAAEDALHRVLREAPSSSASTARLREAAEEALWAAWHRSGDEEVDAALRRGSALMDKEHLEEAVDAFAEAVLRAPEFAEGWNKRATAYFLLQDFERSVADCREVLKLKPRHFGCLAGLAMCYQALGKRSQALVHFKEALEVHPGLDGPQHIVEAMELQEAVNERLRPHLVRVAQALSKGTAVEASRCRGILACDWDMHVLASDSGMQPVYFFRVRVRNRASGPSELQSLARFYALRFVCGRIFPLTRLTEGPAGFSLKPQEEYRFCWHLTAARELRDAAGGMLLLERSGRPEAAADEGRFLSADLEPRVPAEASPDEVERLRLGYHYMGTLNLQQLELGAASEE